MSDETAVGETALDVQLLIDDLHAEAVLMDSRGEWATRNTLLRAEAGITRLRNTLARAQRALREAAPRTED